MGLCLSQLELFFLSPYVAYYRALLLVNISMAPCRGARATHQQLWDWNCAWSPTCHAKMLLFPSVHCHGAQTLSSWKQPAPRSFHRYLALNKAEKWGTDPDFWVLYTVDPHLIIKWQEHVCDSESLWDCNKADGNVCVYVLICLWRQSLRLQPHGQVVICGLAICYITVAHFCI